MCDGDFEASWSFFLCRVISLLVGDSLLEGNTLEDDGRDFSCDF
jgi:hypothetical protein